MPSPIFHSAFGVCLGRAGGRESFDRRAALAFLFAANAADLDLIPGLLVHDPVRYHHGFTHSLAFAAALAALLALIPWSRAKAYAARWAWLAVAAASHPLLDLLSFEPRTGPGNGGYEPIPLFWPLSSARFTTVARVFEGTHISTKLSECASASNLHSFAREAGAGLALIGLVWLATRAPSAAAAPLAEPAGEA